MPRVVRAKFKVVAVEAAFAGARLRLHVVTDGSAENKSFFRYTPAGSIEMSVVEPDTAAFFPLGAEVYVDFSLAAAPPG